jgi:hypothetical protein
VMPAVYGCIQMRGVCSRYTVADDSHVTKSLLVRVGGLSWTRCI